MEECELKCGKEEKGVWKEEKGRLVVQTSTADTPSVKNRTLVYLPLTSARVDASQMY